MNIITRVRKTRPEKIAPFKRKRFRSREERDPCYVLRVCRAEIVLSTAAYASHACFTFLILPTYQERLYKDQNSVFSRVTGIGRGVCVFHKVLAACVSPNHVFY